MADRSGFNRFYRPTLGDMLETGVGAKVECNRCQCERILNIEMLIAKVGPDYSLHNRRCRCKLLPGCPGSNGDQAALVATAAMASRVSRDWKGYWQRAA